MLVTTDISLQQILGESRLPTPISLGGFTGTANGGTKMGINVGDYAGTGSVYQTLAVQTFETGEEDMMLDFTHIESIIWDGSALRSLNDMKTKMAF